MDFFSRVEYTGVGLDGMSRQVTDVANNFTIAWDSNVWLFPIIDMTLTPAACALVIFALFTHVISHRFWTCASTMCLLARARAVCVFFCSERHTLRLFPFRSFIHSSRSKFFRTCSCEVFTRVSWMSNNKHLGAVESTHGSCHREKYIKAVKRLV